MSGTISVSARGRKHEPISARLKFALLNLNVNVNYYICLQVSESRDELMND